MNALETNSTLSLEKQPSYAKISLLQHTSNGFTNKARLHERGIDPLNNDHLPVNCMCIWARPT